MKNVDSRGRFTEINESKVSDIELKDLKLLGNKDPDINPPPGLEPNRLQAFHSYRERLSDVVKDVIG